MDAKLRRLIRLNEAKRKVRDCEPLHNCEFSIDELLADDALPVVQVPPLASSSERIRNGHEHVDWNEAVGFQFI